VLANAELEVPPRSIVRAQISGAFDDDVATRFIEKRGFTLEKAVFDETLEAGRELHYQASGQHDRCRWRPRNVQRSVAEPLDEKAMTEAAVADYQRALSELFHHCSDDARTGQNDIGALGPQSDDRTALPRVARSIHLDLAVDLSAVQNRPVVCGQSVLDRSDVGDSTPHRHQDVWRPMPIDPRQIGGDRRERAAQHVGGDHAG
jgi:hypothetical protein